MQHTSHIAGARHERFLCDYLPVLASRQEAFLIALHCDGEPVAAQAFLRFADIVTFYYSGFRAQYAPFSPVFLLGVEALKWAIANGCKQANFLPNDKPWKSRWGATMRGGLYRCRATRVGVDSVARIGRAALSGSLLFRNVREGK